MSKVLVKLAEGRKAVTAAVLAGVPLLLAALQDTSPGGSDITKAEWYFVAGSTLLAGVGVWNMGNRPQAAEVVETPALVDTQAAAVVPNRADDGLS